MPERERLYLLDGMALAYRAYFTFISRPLRNSKGENTSAIFGFVTALMKILDEEKPDHVAVVFDTKEPTFRHVMFKDYKATRQKMPEEMASQLDKLKEVVRAFNAPLIELPGYEADDIIGTLARRAEKEKVLTYMVTGDKDFMQLISPLIKMVKPGKSATDTEIVDEKGVEEKFGVRPDQVIDVLALIGDKSDNVPGVPGIGEKTAIPLIQKFGTLAELYQHLEDIPQRGVREKLASNRDKAFLSRDLVTIRTDAPVRVDFHQLRVAQRDTAKLAGLFAELDFKSLYARLKESEAFTPAPAAPAPAADVADREGTDITTDEHAYYTVLSEKDLTALAKRLCVAEVFAFDTETTSTDAMSARLVGLSFSMKEREAFYVPVRFVPEGETGAGLFQSPGGGEPNLTASALPLENVLGALKSALEDPKIPKVAQNAKYDMLVLKCHGIDVQNLVHDTMVASYAIRPDGRHNLDALAKEYLNYTMIPYEDLVGKGKSQRHISAVPLEEITNYSAQDADITVRIYLHQLPVLDSLNLEVLCRKIEFPLIPVLTRMESAGVALDTEYLEGMSKDFERQLDNLVREIHGLAGEPFNINSTQQLAEVLFTKLKLPSVRKTKTGFSTDVNVLETLRNQHPIIEKLLDYRQLSKLKSTYIDALPSLVNPVTHRVHTSFNQTVAATGRLSSSDPNLQNIPIRTEMGSAIRKAFITGGSGRKILSADYSQIELRVMAHISGDEGLRDAFRNGEDIHASTAAKVFGVDGGGITRELRRRAKVINFGIMYGIGPFGLASRLEISQTEAKEIIERYFQRFPKVRQYINDTIAGAQRNGFVTTLMGRRRYLPDITSRNQNVRGNAERQAINMPIQGTAADMIKLAMIMIDGEILRRQIGSRMLLQVHDELVFDVPDDEVPLMKELVVEKMRSALPMSVPIEVEVGVAGNWLEAH